MYFVTYIRVTYSASSFIKSLIYCIYHILESNISLNFRLDPGLPLILVENAQKLRHSPSQLCFRCVSRKAATVLVNVFLTHFCIASMQNSCI